jgi:drug/metabolite transporter (DMT)-like permease
VTPRPVASGGANPPGGAHPPGAAEFAMLAFLGTAWGSSFLFTGVAVKAIPPLTLAALRIVIGMTVLLLAARLAGHRLPTDARAWRNFLLMGLTNSAIPFMLLTGGQARIDSGLAAILIAATPLFTLLLAHPFTDDKATPRKIVGAAIGFGGIVLLLGPAALAGIGASVLGQVMILGAGLSFAATQILARRMRNDAPAPISAACSLVCSALWMVPLALAVDRPWAAAADWQAPSGWLAVAGAVAALGCLSTGIAHLGFFWLIGRAGPNFVSMNNYIAPVVGVAWGWLLLGERLSWTAIGGLVVILAGVAFATWPRRRAPKAAPAPAISA